MTRTSWGDSTDFYGEPREVYVLGYNEDIWFEPTGDLSGKLRLVRTGEMMTGYYYSGGWVYLATGVVGYGDVVPVLTCWSHDYAFTDQSVFVVYDNFIVNSGIMSSPTAVGDRVHASRANWLLESFPNPSNPYVTIAFELPHREAIQLGVYDVAGRLVKVLVTGEVFNQGRHEIVWDGRDEAGQQLASGTYFYRLEAGNYVESKRMMLVR